MRLPSHTVDLNTNTILQTMNPYFKKGYKIKFKKFLLNRRHSRAAIKITKILPLQYISDMVQLSNLSNVEMLVDIAQIANDKFRFDNKKIEQTFSGSRIMLDEICFLLQHLHKWSNDY